MKNEGVVVLLSLLNRVVLLLKTSSSWHKNRVVYYWCHSYGEEGIIKQCSPCVPGNYHDEVAINEREKGRRIPLQTRQENSNYCWLVFLLYCIVLYCNCHYNFTKEFKCTYHEDVLKNQARLQRDPGDAWMRESLLCRWIDGHPRRRALLQLTRSFYRRGMWSIGGGIPLNGPCERGLLVGFLADNPSILSQIFYWFDVQVMTMKSRQFWFIFVDDDNVGSKMLKRQKNWSGKEKRLLHEIEEQELKVRVFFLLVSDDFILIMTHLKKSVLQNSFPSLKKHLSESFALHSQHVTQSECQLALETHERYLSRMGLSHPLQLIMLWLKLSLLMFGMLLMVLLVFSRPVESTASGIWAETKGRWSMKRSISLKVMQVYLEKFVMMRLRERLTTWTDSPVRERSVCEEVSSLQPVWE